MKILPIERAEIETSAAEVSGIPTKSAPGLAYCGDAAGAGRPVKLKAFMCERNLFWDGEPASPDKQQPASHPIILSVTWRLEDNLQGKLDFPHGHLRLLIDH